MFQITTKCGEAVIGRLAAHDMDGPLQILLDARTKSVWLVDENGEICISDSVLTLGVSFHRYHERYSHRIVEMHESDLPVGDDDEEPDPFDIEAPATIKQRFLQSGVDIYAPVLTGFHEIADEVEEIEIELIVDEYGGRYHIHEGYWPYDDPLDDIDQDDEDAELPVRWHVTVRGVSTDNPSLVGYIVASALRDELDAEN